MPGRKKRSSSLTPLELQIMQVLWCEGAGDVLHAQKNFPRGKKTRWIILLKLLLPLVSISLWEVSAIGAAGWVLSRLVRRVGPRLHHLLWVTTLGLAAITPAVAVLGALFAPGALPTIARATVRVSVFAQPTRSNGFILPAGSMLVFFLLFLCAFVWSAARLGWSLHYTIKLRREASPISLGPKVEEAWSRCKRAFSVTHAQILHSETVAGPVTIGFLRPVLLVSKGFIRNCPSQDVLAALAHECAQIKRQDFQKNLLYEAASLCVAFHPVVWFLNRKSRGPGK